jgi:hypothetical protein
MALILDGVTPGAFSACSDCRSASISSMAAMSRLDAAIKLDGKAKTSLVWVQEQAQSAEVSEVGEMANTPRERSSYQI